MFFEMIKYDPEPFLGFHKHQWRCAAYLAWFEFDPELIVWSPEFSGELPVSCVPAPHHITRDCVNNRAVIVIIPAKQEHTDKPNIINNLALVAFRSVFLVQEKNYQKAHLFFHISNKTKIKEI